ncbi:hypothetical protein [Halovenus sp. HT40]|uniref:hypothetical protein n=1 Tax=Halovenus sp. HT40 TaxID=3126691 RepID=UPI00300EE79A
MLRTSVLVSTLTLVVVLLAAGAGGVAAQETGPDAETAETAAVTQEQQQFVEAEVIVEDRSGNRLSDIEVVAEWGEGETSSDTTTSGGRVLLDVPADSEVEFRVNDSDDEFVRNHQPVSVGPNDIEEPITIQMAPRGGVTFSVVDTNSEPVQDVRLQLIHEGSSRTVDIVSTDADGSATVSGIEQRTYDVNVFRPGYNRTQQTLELTGQQQSEEIEIESHRVNVDFTVLDDHFENPRPLEGATLDIEGVGTPIPTDESGETQARIPVNDEYDITVLLDGYQERTTTLTVQQEPTELELSTQRTPEISINQLQNAIVIGQPTQVTITNAYAEPVEDAMVSLNGETVGETDAKGQIVFNITQAGDNTIEASYEGLEASTTLRGVDPDADSEDDAPEENETDDSDDSSAETDDSNDDAIGPGFGIVAALGAVIGLALIAARRRS